MKKSLAIIYFTDYYSWPAGGMLQYLYNIIPYLANEYDLTLFGCSIDGKEPDPVLIGNKTYRINVLGNVKTKKKVFPNYLRYIYYTLKMSSKIELQQFDVIYFHAAPIAFAYINRVKKHKNIYAYHQHGLSCKNFIAVKIQNWVMKHSDVVFINATKEEIHVKEKELGIEEGRFIQAPSQVDEKIIKSLKSDSVKPILCYSGRITEWKRPLLLLEAFHVFHKKYPNSELVIIGDGDQRERLEKRIHELNEEAHVHITGFIAHDKVIEKLTEASIFVMPSKGEGLSLSVIEALAVGLPVVSFDVAGLSELVIDGYNGIVADTATPDVLTCAMEKAFNNRELMTENAKKIAQKYTIKRITDCIIQNINKVADNENE